MPVCTRWYTPLNFWILARVAELTELEGWHMVKLGVVGTAFIVPVALAGLWSRVVACPAVLAVVVAVTVMFQSWWEWYAWLSVAIFVPWWLWAVLGVGRVRPGSSRTVAMAALIGAVSFTIYPFAFFVAVVQLPIWAVVRRLVERAAASDPGPRRYWPTAMVVLFGSGLFSAVYWLPLLVDITRGGYDPVTNRYYSTANRDIPFAFLEADMLGALSLVGLGFLLLTACRSLVAMALLTLVAASYVWWVLSYAMFLLDFPIVAVRTLYLIDMVLAVAVGLAVEQIWRTIRDDRRTSPARRRDKQVLTVAAIVLVVLAAAQHAIDTIPYLDEQRAAEVPLQLLDDFETATRGQAGGAVVLTDVKALPVFLDVFVFNAWDAHYAHPAAKFTDRANFLKRLSNEHDNSVFAVALAHNRYDRIEYVVFDTRRSNRLSYEYLDDAFPRGSTKMKLNFAAHQFATDQFDRRATSTLTIFAVDRSHDALSSLRSCLDDPSAPGCGVLDELAARFDDELDAEASAMIADWRAKPQRADSPGPTHRARAPTRQSASTA